MMEYSYRADFEEDEVGLVRKYYEIGLSASYHATVQLTTDSWMCGI